jgi:uncharacterized protein YaiL (DUF2058 family)
MAGTLQDQLLKAGLVDEDRVKAEKKARHAERRKPAGNKKDRAKAAAAPSQGDIARREKKEKARAANAERDQRQGRKAMRAEIRKWIADGRLDRSGGETPWQFVSGGKIRKLLVTDEQHRRLVAGALCVTRLDGIFEVVPREIAERVEAREPQAVVPVNQPGADEQGADDPYAEYKVPDDLTW